MNGTPWRIGLAALLACIGEGTLALAGTNSVPWPESFEGYTNGTLIAGTNGWSTDVAGAGVVTTNPSAVGLLTSYTNAGGVYPLATASHSNVLQVTEVLRNDTRGATGSVVALDFLALPVPVTVPPAVEDGLQDAFCVLTNGDVAIWCQAGGVTQWVELATAPPVGTGVWTRFSLVQDYSLNRFQISVNAGPALTNSAGTGTSNSWFGMVTTNGVMSRFSVGDLNTNYVDDVLVTNRSVRWTGGAFTESGLNNGSIDPTTTLVGTLLWDTWAGTNGENLAASGKASVTGLPMGLTGVVQVTSAAQVTISLSGMAAAQDPVNSVSNGIVVAFSNSAFALGRAWDVTGHPYGGASVTFYDGRRLSFSTNAFTESAANDGSVDTNTVIVVTLTNAIFNGTIGDDFGANTSKVQFTTLPTGLTAQLLVKSATTLELRLTGQAAAHGTADSGSVGWAFRDGAFVGGAASTVVNASTNFTLTFLNPGALTYGATVFAELAANNGAVAGTALSLTNKSFNATNGEDLVASGKVTYGNVPGGLVPVVTVTDTRHATLTFVGNAAAHAASNNVVNLTLSFGNGAFAGGNAAAVANANRSDLSVTFLDQPVLTAGGTTFTEAAADNGTIGNSNTITLVRDVFVSGTYTAGVQFVVTNVPAGLTCGVSASGGLATVTLAGPASAHAAGDSVTNLTLTFLNAAFTAVAASNILGHPILYAVTFLDPGVLTYGTTSFAEVTANNGAVNGTTLNLANKSFNATNGEDLVASGKVTKGNVPAGLTLRIVVTDSQHATLSFVGTATAHTAASSIANLTVTFMDAAFTGGNAAAVASANRSDLAVTFMDPPVLTPGGTAFAEAQANNGTVTNSNTIALVGDTFVAGTYTAGSQFTAANVPPGLTLGVTAIGGQATVTLTGAATSHAAANSVTNLTLTFLNAAFTNVGASNVLGHPIVYTVTFLDPGVLTYGTATFTEVAANNGGVNGTTLSLSNKNFAATNGEDLVASGKVSGGNVPAGLTLRVVLTDSQHATLSFAGNAIAHTAANSIANLTVTFADAAFAGGNAGAVANASRSDLAATFLDPPVLTAGGTTFTEAAANNGTIGNSNTIALAGDTFVTGTYTAGVQYTAANVPAGLTLAVRASGGQAVVTLTGTAAAHAAADSIANLGLAFLDAAFSTVAASNIVGQPFTYTVTFMDAPVLTAGSTFTEAAANNGTIGNSNTITLAGASFAVGPFTAGAQYTVTSVPAGLTFGLTRQSASQLLATLTGTAASHMASNSISNLHLTFLDSAFVSVAAASVLGHPIDFTVSFMDPPALAYSDTVFHEMSVGQIDNRNPITITLTGDVFGGVNGDDFVAKNWVIVSNVPAGLTAQIFRNSDTQLGIQLVGTATNNASSNSVSNVGITFLSAAFANAQADQVLNYAVSGLQVLFIDDIGFFNVMPYEEPFERYANGTFLVATNGWIADYVRTAAIVTNDPAAAAGVLAYLQRHAALPITTNHAQALYVQDDVHTDVHSEGQPLVYLDFMALPMPTPQPWSSDTNLQYAFCVTTNRQMAIWHCNTTGATTNEWRVLTDAALVDTSRWTRFTVAQDYANHRFQIRVNEGAPLTDAAGWNDAHTGHPGSWFNMIQTNASMSRFWISGSGSGYIDDLTVRTALPAFFSEGAGTTFKFR